LPFPGGYELTSTDIESLIALWNRLSSGVLEQEPYRFIESSLRRFNFAFDRLRSDDRVVDLLIAAEALFLDPGSEKDRGELRFRLALRAAKFCPHPSYTRREVFDLMREGYKVRSTVVHGGVVGTPKLPREGAVDLEKFAEAVAVVLRLSLTRALTLATSADPSFGTSEYWNELLFPEAPVSPP
jgi:Apea-like HEPN